MYFFLRISKHPNVMAIVTVLFLCSTFALILFNNPLTYSRLQWNHLEVHLKRNSSSAKFNSSLGLFVPTIFKGMLNSSFNPQSCSPKTKIGFAKTHKTASSTVQNVLLRYGLHNHLNFVLPGPKIGNILSPMGRMGRGTLFNAAWLRSVPWHSTMVKDQTYNIAALHTRWNRPEFEKVLGSKAEYFTILREPSTAFESLFSYMDMKQRLQMTLPTFIKRASNNKTLATKTISGMGLNQQLYDLGLPLNKLFDKMSTNKFIKQLDKQFGLVMIAERMQESFVLLADRLCVPLYVVASLKVNARKQKAIISLNQNDTKSLKTLQSNEEHLYHFFLDKLESQIEAFGQARMEASVAELIRLNAHVQTECVVGAGDRKSMKDSKYKPWSSKVQMWIVREDVEECPLMAIKEVALIDMVREEQLQRWKKKNL